MAERWRPVPGYEGLYLVSDRGRVRSADRRDGDAGRAVWSGRNLQPRRRQDGYEDVILTRRGRSAKFLVHRLVLSAFVGEPGPGLECNHKNGVKHDNRLENLEWVTRSENMRHAYRLGLITLPDTRGEKNGGAKLTADAVRQIRRLAADGKQIRELAEQYGVGVSTISDAVRRATWRHVWRRPAGRRFGL